MRERKIKREIKRMEEDVERVEGEDPKSLRQCDCGAVHYVKFI